MWKSTAFELENQAGTQPCISMYFFFHSNIYNPSCWVVSAVGSGISAVRSSSLHMPLTTKRARELFLLPFQSCERCPGKSSHISPWVQMVARPKYALQRHTDTFKEHRERRNTIMTREESFLILSFT